MAAGGRLCPLLGGCARRGAVPGPADRDADHFRNRGADADDAVEHDRRVAARLCHPCPRQGAFRTYSADAPRLSQRLRADPDAGRADARARSEEHTSELQSLMRISYAVFCLTNNSTDTHRTPLYNN